MKLRVATCQLPVSSDVDRNARYVLRHMRTAKQRGAHVAHFGEGCLSGYPPADLPGFEGFDWRRLRARSEEVLELAARLRLWVLVGSAHPLSGRRKPHNSVYVIDDRGRIVDRYDKRFCSGSPSGRTGDLSHYTPGDHTCVFEIRGIRCGVLICHEYRYPELYREYKRRGVQLVFHAYHAGHMRPAAMRELERYVGRAHQGPSGGRTLPEITMPASMRAAAGSNHVWISCSNTSARESCWPAFFVRPDGVVTGRLRRNTAGVLLSTVDPREELYDSTADWRGRAMRGVLHSGRTLRDARSQRRSEL